MVRRPTAPIDGKASPRNPSVRMASRSSSSSLEVAWRSTASSRSRRGIPSPSSITRMKRRPPPSVATSMRVAPASSAFSTSSFTTLAGRSTTSPAAMRLTVASDNWRTGISFFLHLAPLAGRGRPSKARSGEGLFCSEMPLTRLGSSILATLPARGERERRGDLVFLSLSVRALRREAAGPATPAIRPPAYSAVTL